MQTPEKKRRGRRRRKKRATSPLDKPRVLDLAEKTDVALTEAEIREAKEHLAFLRRFKRNLRLSLNATEDLLVNGARAPEERGVLKHLFSKVDRQVVHQALAREPLASDDRQRTEFLGGLVRLNPDRDTLLEYLGAVGKTADRREAARAFALTIERIDFAEASPAELSRMLEVVRETFEGPDRTRAHLALLTSERFRDPLPEALTELGAAYAVVVDGKPIPDDGRKRAVVMRGVAAWIDAPASLLDTYDVALRARLAEVVLDTSDGPLPSALARVIGGIPPKSPHHRNVALRYAAVLAANGDAARAKKVLGQVLSAHPNDAQTKRVERALAWPIVGPLAVESGSRTLRRAYALDGSGFGWARVAPPEAAGTLVAETRLMLDLLIPNVATVVANGIAPDGRAYAFAVADGYPLEEERRLPRLDEALTRTDTAIRLLRALSQFGIELPDVAPSRFLVRKDRLILADLSGATASNPARAALTNAGHASAAARVMLDANGTLRDDTPPELAARLETPTPLPLLIRTLAMLHRT